MRGLIFDLTFTISPGVSSQQVLYANMAAMEQQMVEQQIEGDLYQVPLIKGTTSVKENEKVQEIDNMLKKAAFEWQGQVRLQSDPYQLPSGVLLQKNERGELLYRSIYTVRCLFEGTDERET